MRRIRESSHTSSQRFAVSSRRIRKFADRVRKDSRPVHSGSRRFSAVNLRMGTVTSPIRRPSDCCSPHSVASTECGEQQSDGLRPSGRYRQHAWGQRRRQTFASPSTVRWSSAVATPPSSWRAQASPIRPEQPSLASVHSGRRHGCWCRIRAPSSARTCNLGAVRSF